VLVGRVEYARRVEIMPDDAFQPDRAWWGRLFAVIDARDAPGFLSLLTPDAQFRFGNAPMITGTEQIGAAVTAFFAAIAACHHQLLMTWHAGATIACEGTVTYTRHNGSTVTVPFANVFEMRGAKICAYRIYIDNSPLFAAVA
jgi:ketosteroid isomerase-like protein